MEKIYPTTAVRYGRTRQIGEFSHEADMRFSCGGKVVIQTDRGIEIGEQVSLTCHGCEKSVSRDQMRAYAKASGSDCYRLNNGRILREATEADVAENRHILDSVQDKIRACRSLAEELGLPMKIVDAEHLFGGERVIFYFMSEDRVDFRELVRQLAREFQTRIEMRQVGARDEARLLADFETCGRECCCKNFLKTLKPVGMQMAKLQKATLDPSKVSGRCGRLKCCLRYEHDSYAELNKKLPRLGRRVRTEQEVGVVIDRQILTQLVRLRKDDGTLVTVCEEDIVERDLPMPPPPVVSERENGDRGNGRGRRDSGPNQDRSSRRSDGDRRSRGERPAPQPLRDQAASGIEPLDDDSVADEDMPADADEAGLEQSAIDGGEREEGRADGEAAGASSSDRPGDGQPGNRSQGGQGGGQGRRRNRNRRRRRRGGDRSGPPGPQSPPPA